jgi:hypothetical protein
MKRFWISWYQPTEDYRPLKEGIEYWCTGQTLSEPEQYTLCAIVDAKDEESAEARILKDWPEVTDWRFCEERETDWRPPSDRFSKRV